MIHIIPMQCVVSLVFVDVHILIYIRVCVCIIAYNLQLARSPTKKTHPTVAFLYVLPSVG